MASECGCCHALGELQHEYLSQDVHSPCLEGLIVMGEGEALGEGARRVAELALETGRADDALAAAEGRILDPVPIHSPEGAMAGWFVPVELDGVLLGFVQVDERGRFHRYASLRGGIVINERGPRVADWLDPETITQRARALAEPMEALSTPVLTYDRSPDRLVWAVRATKPDGRERTIYVAGSATWTPPEDS